MHIIPTKFTRTATASVKLLLIYAFLTQFASAAPAMTANPSTLTAGSATTLTWSGVTGAAATDWIGLYATGAANSDYIDWLYTSCTKNAGSAARSSGSCSFPVPAATAAGGYELRLYSKGTYSLIVSANFTVSAASAPKLTLNTTSVPAGGTLTASWTGFSAATSTDWMALFAAGAPNTAYLDWMYTSCTKSAGSAKTSGSCAFPVPSTLGAGNYEIRLLSKGTFTSVAASTFSLAAPAVTASPSAVQAGNAVTIGWSGIGGANAADWIGLYVAGSDQTDFKDWMYVSCSKTAGSARTSGSCSMTVPSGAGAGTYEARLFSNGTYSVFGISNAFAVTAKVNQKPSVAAGADQSITLPAKATVTAAATDDGLPNNSLSYQWSVVSGSGVTFTNAAAASTQVSFGAAGSYTLRLTVSDGALNASDDVVVNVAAPAVPTLTVTPTKTTAGATVTATWSNIPSAFMYDWMALYTPGTDNTEYIDWIYVSCSKAAGTARASGSCQFPMPASIAPGTYEIRIFSNGTYGVIATSNPITVGGLSFTATPAAVQAGDNVSAAWEGVPGAAAADWIGLYAAGAEHTAFLDWQYVSCSKSMGSAVPAGSCTFSLPGSLASGQYVFRLFSNGTYTMIAETKSFSVNVTVVTGRVQLAWDANTESDLAGYNVYRAESGTWTRLNSGLLASPSFTDGNVEGGRTYTYAVKAVNAAGGESDSSNTIEVSIGQFASAAGVDAQALAASADSSQASTVSLTLVVSKSGEVLQSTNTPVSAWSDDSSVLKLELLIDGRLVATQEGSSLTYTWDTRFLSGSHTVQTVAYDNAGGSTTRSVDVIVY